LCQKTIKYHVEKKVENPKDTKDWVSCELIVYLDNREYHGGLPHLEIFNLMSRQGMTIDRLNLPLGDICWICRAKKRRPTGEVFTVNYLMNLILERKTVDDLKASMEDGRYEEQKFRLMRCGLSNVVYLVEGEVKNYDLENELIKTQILNGFYVQNTQDKDDTVRYLKAVADIFQKELDKKVYDNVSNFIYEDWTDIASKSKNITISDMFARFLMQVKGVSEIKVAAILKFYPTLNSLCEAYSKIPNINDKVSLLSNIEFDDGKILGIKLSRAIADAFSF